VNTGPLYGLVERWREDARGLHKNRAVHQAELLEDRARMLAEEIAAWENEPLTLRDAEAESGYSYSTLQQYLANGTLPNAGSPGRPRVRRRDLPYRGARSTDGPDIASSVLLSRL
jgi:hypothetical protein